MAFWSLAYEEAKRTYFIYGETNGDDIAVDFSFISQVPISRLLLLLPHISITLYALSDISVSLRKYPAGVHVCHRATFSHFVSCFASC